NDAVFNVFLDGIVIWSGEDLYPPTHISSWLGSPTDRQVDLSARLGVFYGTYAASSGYNLRLTFDNGCQVSSAIGPFNIRGEVGQVTDLDHNPQTVILGRTYTDPVVIARPASINESDPSLVRITDVQTDRFTFYIDEAPDMDGNHDSVEVVSYLVLESGDWELANGTLLEVGKVTTTASVGKLISNQWETVTLSAGFSDAPAVFSQVQSENDASFVGTRQQNTSAGSFDVAMEEEEASTAPHGSETIGWVAIEAASGAWSGHRYQSGITPGSVSNRWYTVGFSPAFSTAPRFIAALYTYAEEDNSHLRYQSLGAADVEVMIEEDTTYDSEMRHKKEKVSWLAIEGDGTLDATAVGVGYLPNDAANGYVRTEGRLSSFGGLGSVIQSLTRLWNGLVLSSGPQQEEEPTATPIATPSLTPAVSTATPIPVTGTATSTAIPTSSPTALLEPTLLETALDSAILAQAESLTFGAPVTIDYTYDPLYRLTAADYDTGEFFHYTYDAVGNRLTQDTHEGSNTYLYDIANRLIEVDSVVFTWDDNGNLQSDCVSTYNYDHANRLISVEQGVDTYTYAYNGLGDRLSQTVNGVPTNYSLDMVTGLTQVLSDGTNDYLYGAERIGELQPSGWRYHLSDALGSVRQLVDGAGTLAQSRSFEPFGNELVATSISTSAYGFTGEWGDETGLLHLRARYLGSDMGIFLTRDPVNGIGLTKQLTNDWIYAEANPINLRDPSGEYPISDDDPVTKGIVEYCSLLQGWERKECELGEFLGNRTSVSERPPYITWSPAVMVGPASQIGRNQYYPKHPITEREMAEGIWGKNLCGAISLEMIYETVTFSEFQLGVIWDALGNTRSSTSVHQLARAVLKAFPKTYDWMVQAHIWGHSYTYAHPAGYADPVIVHTSTAAPYWYGSDAQYKWTLWTKLAKQRYLVPLVHISTSQDGALVSSTKSQTGHWVVLTGLSAQWDESSPSSDRNWVRIRNPFKPGREEYYPWQEFVESLSPSRSLLEFWR
ncbi:MAG: RHS repeat-associated core domain-containing protein, partial [Anaerolineales bacterium]